MYIVCFCFSYPDQMHYATNRGSSFQHKGFRRYLKYHNIVYFVIQLLSEPDKQNVACLFKRQLLLILSRTQN